MSEGEENGTLAGVVYFAFGLRILSEIALPELDLAPAVPDGPPEVVIRRGPAPFALAGARQPDPAMQVAGSHFLLTAPAGRYLVSNGRTITVDAPPGVSEDDIRLYLLGTAFGGLLHQRSILPLHANAIGLGDVAVAFAGPAGAGKSTLAAYFQSMGRSVLCDDVCAVWRRCGADAVAQPGLARIKLWREALEGLGLDPRGLRRVAHGLEKFSLPSTCAGPRRALPLRGLYILTAEPSARVEIRRLTGAAAMSALVGNIYRWPLAAAMNQATGQFANCVDLLASCEVFEIARPNGFTALGETAAAVEAHVLEALPLAAPVVR